MAQVEEESPQRSFWKRLPELWKFVTLLLAIGGTAIAGYQVWDNAYDDLKAKDAALLARLDRLEGEMVRSSDLTDFVGSAKLRLETCILVLRAEMHEYRALRQAYEDLLAGMDLAQASFLVREPLSPGEERQLTRIAELRGSIASKKSMAQQEEAVLNQRISLRDGC